MSGIAPDGRESRWVLVCQGNSPEIICAKLFILLIGGLKLLSPFTLFQLCWKPLAGGIHPKTPAHQSVTELIIFTLREKKNPTSLHLLCMHVKKAGHLKLLLAQTSCCSYSTGRGRETQDLTVPLRKAFSGHIKDKLFHHSSGAGKGDSANQLSTPRRPPVPFPPYIEPSRHCKVSRCSDSSPLPSRAPAASSPPPSLLTQNKSKAPDSAASRGKPRTHTFQ